MDLFYRQLARGPVTDKREFSNFPFAVKTQSLEKQIAIPLIVG
jgi:hypothetical protein